MKDNGTSPATKADLAKLRDELLQAMAGQREELLEAIHDGETRLLKAFYAYADSAQKHFVDLDRADASFRDRLGALETRLVEVEKRLNMPRSS